MSPVEKNHVGLSVIIPVRLTEARTDIVERLEYCLSDQNLNRNTIEFIVVDDGSPNELSFELKNRCEELFLTFIKTNSGPNDHFNLAKARNYGAQHANGELLLFLDVDLITLPDFYMQIINEASLMDIKHYISRFLMCPVIYLTPRGHNEFNRLPAQQKRSYCINAMLYDNRELVEKFSSGTSAIIVNRHYYMAIGGQNESFSGWGYEDYEFTTRLMANNPQFLRPNNWSSMAGNFMTINKYSGWKAAYRLHGDFLAAKGIYLIHAPHPVDESFRSAPDRNLPLLKKELKKLPNEFRLKPLPYKQAGVSVIFRKNPFCYSYEFAPFLGEVLFVDESDFIDADKRTAFIESNKVSRIIFGNPYANDSLRDIYNWARKTNFPFIVAERGALPDSVYHDPSGFLSDGDSYRSDKWDKPLSENQIKLTKEYISKIQSGSEMLEAQSKRKSLSSVRTKIGLKKNQKMVLVPFQQPNDTVVLHFSGSVKSFKNFHDVISRLPSELGEEWLVVYKKHPVEDSLSPISGAVNADDINLYDLIEIADAMVVINSGTGVYGMMFGIPVYILGDAFYSDPHLNATLKNPNSLARKIKVGYEVDLNYMLRFINYLRYEHYSFGTQEQRKARTGYDNAITATSSIHYYELRNWRRSVNFYWGDHQKVPWTSSLYDRYRYHGRLNNILRGRSINNKSVLFQAKLKKLRERPIQFFIDATHNIFI